MAEQRSTWWHSVIKWLDDALPLSPVDREEREDDGRDNSASRRLRLKLHQLEKRGKGGYR